MSDRTTGDRDGVGVAEQHELEQMRRELDASRRRTAELEARLGIGEPATPAASAHRVRGAVAVVCLILGALLTPVSIAAVYARTELIDTDHYVQTVGPLASDPSVQAYLADAVTTRVLARVNLSAYVTNLLPKRAAPLAGPITGALRSFVHGLAVRVVDSQAFRTTWVSANRIAHREVVALLTGQDSDHVVADHGVVYLNLNPVIRQVTRRLSAAGLGIVSKVPVHRIQGRVALFRSNGLYRTRTQISLALKLAWLLPFLTVGLLLASAWLSGNRRRGLLRAATGFAVGALILAVALALSRGAYLDAVTGVGLPARAAGTVFDTLLAPMHQVMRIVMSLSVLTLVATVVAGPSRPARWLRAWVLGGIGHLGRIADDSGWRGLGPMGFLQDNTAAARIAAVFVGVLVLLWWDHPTPVVIVWLGVAVVALVLVVEFYARPTPAADPDATEPGSEPPVALA